LKYFSDEQNIPIRSLFASNGCTIMNGPLGILHLSPLFFHIEKKLFVSKDSSWNSLQNVTIFIILNNLHYFVTYDTIDLSKNHNFQTQHFFEFFLKHILILWSLLLWMSLYSKEIKYTTRCSVKSSTIYKLKFIVIVYFLFSKKSQNSVRPMFAVAKTDRTEFRVLFSIKSTKIK